MATYMRPLVRTMSTTQTGLIFISGLVLGFILSYAAMNYGNSVMTGYVYKASSDPTFTSQRPSSDVSGESSFGHHAFGQPMNHEEVEMEDKQFLQSNQGKLNQYGDAHKHEHDDDSVAKDLYNKVSVLVWVMTQPSSLESKARHVNNTWGHRANKILFASDTYDPKFPTIPITIPHGRDHLTAKTMASFDYVYKNHLDDYDWFMKADDDSYVIMENLRYFLSDEDPNDPVFFGHWFKVIVKPQGYYSGGGGYVLSREALKRFGERSPNLCQKDHGAEDVAFGHCMQSLGVKTKSSLDNMGRSRFHCFNPETHRRGGFPDWYYKYDMFNATHKGVDGMSDYPITYHYCSVQVMYDLEYYVYHMKPYGIMSGLQQLNINSHTHQDTNHLPNDMRESEENRNNDAQQKNEQLKESRPVQGDIVEKPSDENIQNNEVIEEEKPDTLEIDKDSIPGKTIVKVTRTRKVSDWGKHYDREE